MKESKMLDSDVKHDLRTPAGRSDQFLIRAIDRYPELGRMEKNWKAQMQQQDRERSAKSMPVVAAAEADAS